MYAFDTRHVCVTAAGSVITHGSGQDRQRESKRQKGRQEAIGQGWVTRGKARGTLKKIPGGMYF